MNEIERAAEVLRARLSWPTSENCARDLANNGLLLTDADRAVLEAAEAWYVHACPATRTGHPTVDSLILAVRVRREATS